MLADAMAAEEDFLVSGRQRQRLGVVRTADLEAVDDDVPSAVVPGVGGLFLVVDEFSAQSVLARRHRHADVEQPLLVLAGVDFK
jgi:hypothetical protein